MSTNVAVSQSEQYRQLKGYSSVAEKDILIQELLQENTSFDNKEDQVKQVFGKWRKIQISKFADSVVPEFYNILLALQIKSLDPEGIRIGIRTVAGKCEYWVICKKKDYSLLDQIYDIYESLSDKLFQSVDFVFISEEQFIGKDIIEFSHSF